MEFNDLLRSKNIDPEAVLLMRHRPTEPQLNKVFPWIASTRPDLFNTYQQVQGEQVEKAMHKLVNTGYVASFIGIEAGKALFIGLYAINGLKPISYAQYWKIAENIVLKKFGMNGVNKDRKSVLWFDLVLKDIYLSWKGKLVVNWSPPERSWWRRAHRNEMQIFAIHEESVLEADMPEWDTLDLSWDELSVLPIKWKSALSQWRGVYYIFDTSDGKALTTYTNTVCP